MSEVLADLRARLPGMSWSAVAPQELPVLPAPGIALKPLRRALKKALRPVFLVNDKARIIFRHLPEVLAELWEAAPEGARIVIATGTHGGGPLGYYQDRLGGLPIDPLHDANDSRAHVELIPGDPPIRIDRRVAQADLIVAFGSVEPHYFAGWTGAHKTATVGVLDRPSIQSNHIHALETSARPLALEGNPIFDDLARIVTALEEDRRLLCVNHVLDEAGAPLAMAVGTWRGTLRRCIPAARARCVRTVPAQVDVLLARVEGPLAGSLYQADKGLKNNEATVRDGGDLLLEAELEHGVGQDRFLRLLDEAPDLAAARAHVESAGYLLGDHKAVRWRALEDRGVKIRIISPHLDPASVAQAGLEVHPTLEAALEALQAEGRGGEGQGLVVEDAGFVVTEVA